jgi:predicted CoA-binding protein
MALPPPVADFLRPGARIAVAGVSRNPNQPANAIFRKLRAAGHEVIPVNPNATQLEGAPCYPNLESIPGAIDGVVVVTHPNAAVAVVREYASTRPGDPVKRIWFHRSIGDGSVSQQAIDECKAKNIDSVIVGGCPMMYCEPVDVAHRCMRSILRFFDRVPG